MEQDLMQERKEMGPVDQRQANQLLHNKFVVVLGDSIHRGIYKDIVVMLRKDGHVSSKQLKNKGEISFEQDCLVEGGQLGVMSNGTSYREVRQYRTEHHMIRFYFITKIFSRYMRSVLADFQRGLKPDLVILNSCLWDVSRYSGNWVMEYRENLKQFFTSLKATLPQESLVVWNMAMPLADKIVGGFLVPEIQHMEPMLRFDVIEANYYAATLANDFGFNVLDLHFQFRLSLQHRMPDGVHWNATAHRKITHLLLEHVAQAWGVTWSKPDETKERRPLLPSPVPFQGIEEDCGHCHSMPPRIFTAGIAKNWHASGTMFRIPRRVPEYLSQSVFRDHRSTGVFRRVLHNALEGSRGCRAGEAVREVRALLPRSARGVDPLLERPPLSPRAGPISTRRSPGWREAWLQQYPPSREGGRRSPVPVRLPAKVGTDEL